MLLLQPQNVSAYSDSIQPEAAGLEQTDETGSLTGGFADPSDYELMLSGLAAAQPGGDYGEHEVVFYLGSDPEEDMRPPPALPVPFLRHT